MSAKKRSIHQEEAVWRTELSAEQYRVCREKGTERPFSGQYHDCTLPGVYVCACCKTPLFESQAKFDAGCGWPSFDAPLHPEHIEEQSDNSHYMQRTEVLCQACGAHLGHVFDDGPTPTGLRYCINSVALLLEAMAPSKPSS